MTDRYSTYDAGYLLGALTPADRSDYEGHLAGCADCRQAVNQLAGVPGLLSSLTEDQARATGEGQPEVPETLLPKLLAEVERTRFRRRVTTALVAAAAVVVLAVTLFVGLRGDSTGQDVAGSPTVQQMTPISQELPVRATAKLSDADWGTRIVVVCRYLPTAQDWGPYTYTMVVTGKNGQQQDVATWKAEPGPPVVVDGSTSIPADEIRSIDVLGPDQTAILTLHP